MSRSTAMRCHIYLGVTLPSSLIVNVPVSFWGFFMPSNPPVNRF